MPQDGKAFALTIELVRDDAVLSQLFVQLPPAEKVQLPAAGEPAAPNSGAGPAAPDRA